MADLTPTEKEQVVRKFAMTYETASDASPWELCQQYQNYLEYTADHPNHGRVRVANNMVDDPLPPSRVRTWLDGGMPDAMHGIQTCEPRGWLDLTWEDDTLHNLTVLIGWIFAGGSITNSWIPYLSAPDPASQERATDLLGQLEVAPEIVRNDDDSRVTEVRPTEAASSLGRLLTVLGAPVGHKNTEAQLSLPPWLAEAPRDLRLTFARIYVWKRGVKREDRPGTPVQLSEDRSLGFYRELQTFLNGVAGAPVVVGGGSTTYLKPAAAALLNRPPTIK